jgi:type IV pilus assembly protein PilW
MTATKHSYRHSLRGFSLVELMIAMSLGLLIIGVVTGIFLSGNRNYAQDERYARIQENARFAMKALLTDISSADFWGGMTSPETITNGTGLASPICNIPLSGTSAANPALVLVTNETAANITWSFPCITKAKANTSAIAIRRVQGACLASAADPVYGAQCATTAPVVGRVYLRVIGTTGDLITAAATTVIGVGERYWEFIPRIYYIRRYSVNDGDGIPTLVRKSLQAGAMADVPLVEGVENFVITPGTPSGTEAPLPIRVHLLARSLDRDLAYDVNRTDVKTYWLGASCFNTAGDDGCIALQTIDNTPQRYYRRVFSSAIAVRNPGILAQYR